MSQSTALCGMLEEFTNYGADVENYSSPLNWNNSLLVFRVSLKSIAGHQKVKGKLIIDTLNSKSDAQRTSLLKSFWGKLGFSKDLLVTSVWISCKLLVTVL